MTGFTGFSQDLLRIIRAVQIVLMRQRDQLPPGVFVGKIPVLGNSVRSLVDNYVKSMRRSDSLYMFVRRRRADDDPAFYGLSFQGADTLLQIRTLTVCTDCKYMIFCRIIQQLCSFQPGTPTIQWVNT